MFYTLLSLLLLVWLVSVLANVGGGFIHLLLAVVLAMFIYDLAIGRTPAA